MISFFLIVPTWVRVYKHCNLPFSNKVQPVWDLPKLQDRVQMVKRVFSHHSYEVLSDLLERASWSKLAEQTADPDHVENHLHIQIFVLHYLFLDLVLKVSVWFYKLFELVNPHFSYDHGIDSYDAACPSQLWKCGDLPEIVTHLHLVHSHVMLLILNNFLRFFLHLFIYFRFDLLFQTFS